MLFVVSLSNHERLPFDKLRANGTYSKKLIKLPFAVYTLCAVLPILAVLEFLLVGGMGTLCPERREEIVAMGLKALIAGVLASLMIGAIVGLI